MECIVNSLGLLAASELEPNNENVRQNIEVDFLFRLFFPFSLRI
jgi:hypothetical protein